MTLAYHGNRIIQFSYLSPCGSMGCTIQLHVPIVQTSWTTELLQTQMMCRLDLCFFNLLVANSILLTWGTYQYFYSWLKDKHIWDHVLSILNWLEAYRQGDIAGIEGQWLKWTADRYQHRLLPDSFRQNWYPEIAFASARHKAIFAVWDCGHISSVNGRRLVRLLLSGISATGWFTPVRKTMLFAQLWQISPPATPDAKFICILMTACKFVW